jgi:hypothetical protein
MNDLLKVLAAAVAGAAAMYYFDPQTGRRRRAVVRDKAVAIAHDTGDLARARGRDVSNRLHGLAAATRSRMQRRPLNDGDRQLHDRLRARLGRVVGHPRAIEVDVFDGQARLTGDILAAEVDALLKEMRSVDGVRHVDNQLTVHEAPDGIPALQGSRRRAANVRWTTLGSVLVAVAAPVAVIAAARARPPARSRWTRPVGRSTERFTRLLRGETRIERARRQLKELLSA